VIDRRHLERARELESRPPLADELDQMTARVAACIDRYNDAFDSGVCDVERDELLTAVVSCRTLASKYHDAIKRHFLGDRNRSKEATLERLRRLHLAYLLVSDVLISGNEDDAEFSEDIDCIEDDLAKLAARIEEIENHGLRSEPT
jgi:hypothetical protein